ncbi:Os04g0295100 [Oryza sativa Japonica Group]|uniref:Os04g0295100 protein n=1 Tax=Oryza sativa subsp. japonica TaxID=39947 RepID=A0A0P0W8H6_ORYSJ|nr:Os04g0295100 [Oryza sativa Japonica Group]
MVHFKNRYMVMEVFIDTPVKGQPDPLILTQINITKAIKDSIQLNFGECGLAACLGSLQGVYELCSSAVKYVNPITKLCVIRVSREDHQKVWAAITMVRNIGKIPVSFNLRDMSGSIRACKKAALECEEAKFEYYKLAAGDRITPKFVETMESCFAKIKGLES